VPISSRDKEQSRMKCCSFFTRKDDDPITMADKLVTLESQFAPFHLSIKFPLKDMLYKGELSL